MTEQKPPIRGAGGPGGQGPLGGKVIPMPVKTRILESRLGPKHWEQRQKDFDRLVYLSRAVEDARTMDQLTACILGDMSEVFNPDTILPLRASGRLHHSYSALNPMVETAIEQQKLIYLPDIRNGRAVTVEDAPGGNDLLYSVPVGVVGGDLEALKKTKLSSVVMAPMLARDLDGGVNSCYGVLLLFSNRPELLHKLAGVVPLRRYTEKLGRAAQWILER